MISREGKTAELKWRGRGGVRRSYSSLPDTLKPLFAFRPAEANDSAVEAIVRKPLIVD